MTETRISAKQLGERLYLDSGTLTPVLKSLEKKGYITRARNSTDERILDVELTDPGAALRDEVLHIPYSVSGCISLDKDEAAQLYRLLYKVLGKEV